MAGVLLTTNALRCKAYHPMCIDLKMHWTCAYGTLVVVRNQDLTGSDWLDLQVRVRPVRTASLTPRGHLPVSNREDACAHQDERC